MYQTSIFSPQDDGESPTKKRPRLPPLPTKAAEDKKKNIKSLIDRIPTSKAELFAYPVDRSQVDEVRGSVCCVSNAAVL